MRTQTVHCQWEDETARERGLIACLHIVGLSRLRIKLLSLRTRGRLTDYFKELLNGIHALKNKMLTRKMRLMTARMNLAMLLQQSSHILSDVFLDHQMAYRTQNILYNGYPAIAAQHSRFGHEKSVAHVT